MADRPKPLAMIGDTPFLQILVRLLADRGVKDFVLLTGYMSEMIEEHFLGEPSDGLNIRISREPEPLGTGGAVKLAESFATDPTLLVNGDTYLDCDLRALWAFHRDKAAAVTLSLRQVDDVSRYGCVAVNHDGFVIGFTEKQEGAVRPGLINAGVSLFSRDLIERLPAGRAFSMEKEIFPSLAKSGKMAGLRQDGDFFDIGTPDSYEDFKEFIRTSPAYLHHRK